MGTKNSHKHGTQYINFIFGTVLFVLGSVYPSKAYSVQIKDFFAKAQLMAVTLNNQKQSLESLRELGNEIQAFITDPNNKSTLSSEEGKKLSELQQKIAHALILSKTFTGEKPCYTGENKCHLDDRILAIAFASPIEGESCRKTQEDRNIKTIDDLLGAISKTLPVIDGVYAAWIIYK